MIKEKLFDGIKDGCNKVIKISYCKNLGIQYKKHVGGSSQYKGVYWDKKKKHWKVMFSINGKVYYVGIFVHEIDAARAYDVVAKKNFGDKAITNF